MHLASPFVLGGGGAVAAARLRLPMVAVYQTDMAGYARAYRLGPAGQAAAWRRLRRIHNAADRTLAPSTAAAASLHARGIDRVWLWARGVDTGRFDPAKRSERWRAELAPGGEVLAGYVGRLAPEKRVDLLAQVATLPGVRLVLVGSGPAEAAARRAMPAAVFLGQRHGEELASIYASLDLFVHSGPHETFGQTLQEAAASGLPVVAPAAGGPLDLVEPRGDRVPGAAGRPRRAGRRGGQAGRRSRAARPPGPRGPAAGARPELVGPGRRADRPLRGGAPDGQRGGGVGLTTFVALGDSFTLGVGDPVRRRGARAWRGWAALLAEGLREPRLHNLASSGAQSHGRRAGPAARGAAAAAGPGQRHRRGQRHAAGRLRPARVAAARRTRSAPCAPPEPRC